MELQQLAPVLGSATAAAAWLRPLGVQDARQGYQNLLNIARCGVSSDLLPVIFTQLEALLPTLDSPGLVLDTFDRFLAASVNPLSLGSLIERDPEALKILVQLFNHSRMLGDLLVSDPAAFELVRLTNGQPVDRDQLIIELKTEIEVSPNGPAAAAALRRHKGREIIRIAYGDLLQQQTLAIVTQQISYLADALCESALGFAQRQLKASRGEPRMPGGEEPRFSVIALSNLGGTELSYGGSLELLFLYDGDGKTDGSIRVSNDEYYERLAGEIVELLTDETDAAACYQVTTRNPLGTKRKQVAELRATLRHFDVKGRTWERLEFIKARAIAGAPSLGEEFLVAMEPWVYRRYLNRADLSGVKALKRRLEKQTLADDDTEPLLNPVHEIHKIEFVIQFLQLLNGGDMPSLRTANTLEAVQRLNQAGCLDAQECSLLTDNYSLLRRIEHLMETMFPGQEQPDEQQIETLAKRLGYKDPAAVSLQDDYQRLIQHSHAIENRLLDDAFVDVPKPGPEVDLVLDPDPAESFIEQTLSPYRFQNLPAAYENLNQLATERIPFLSTRRCRHFLAQIAPALLQAVGETPDPDGALENLSRVSDSLGGKGVLWELFSFSPPTLQLYVSLCAQSPYLSKILTSNPGMLDELMDTLVLNRLPDHGALARVLDDWCRGASDVDTAMINFKHVQHLNAGVRDLLGKEDIRRTTGFLADVAQVCLARICDTQFEVLVDRYGQPWHAEQDRICQPIMLALGKLGNREPNYHSDLDVLFLYETEGTTRPVRPGRQPKKTTSHQHFFGELAQRITKAVNRLGPSGRLYELDTKLRPTSKRDRLAISLDGMAKYFGEDNGTLGEYQALCNARPIYGSSDAQPHAAEQVKRILSRRRWNSEDASEIRRRRLEVEGDDSARNLKRGRGGLLDVEFTVQMLKLKNAARHPEILVPGTVRSLRALAVHGCLENQDAEALSGAYRFLRGVEARLRLMNTTARHDLPSDDRELNKLANLLGLVSGQELSRQCFQTMDETRGMFEHIFTASSQD